MNLWRKRPEPVFSHRDFARAAYKGASRQELVREAITLLAREGRADRVGIWLDTQNSFTKNQAAPSTFHGLVWDLDDISFQAQWAQLSPEAPLPAELLAGRKAVEQKIDDVTTGAYIGPLLELRHVLWIPIEVQGVLLGILLAGLKSSQGSLLTDLFAFVAAELALALEIEQERRAVREHSADLALTRKTLSALERATPADSVLQTLVENCTAANGEGPGAVFAMIGSLVPPQSVFTRDEHISFSFKSGDAAWTTTAQTSPIASVWREALETRQLAGTDPRSAFSQDQVARVLAIPLESSGNLLGVLVAGLAPSAATHATIERLQLRATLAVSAFARHRQQQVQLHQTVMQRALMDSSSDPTLLLDEHGVITAMNRAAQDVLDFPRAQESLLQKHNSAEPVWLPQLFRASDRASIVSLLRSHKLEPPRDHRPSSLSLETQLLSGARVRLRFPVPPGLGYTTLLLEPIAGRAATASQQLSESELQTVLEWLEEGVVLFDADENVRVMNTRFQQIAGFDPKESASIKTLDALITRLADRAAEPPLFESRWRELASGIDGGVREELQLLHPAPRVLERASRPILDSSGRRAGRVEVYRDLTAHRVFQSKLLQTEKLAALGQMVSGVAHELNNPLTSILGYAQRLLLREEAPGKITEARQIFQEAERAGAILRQLLLNARETPPERRTVALNQIVLKSMDLLRFGAAAEKIHVELDLDPSLPFVFGDGGQLQQVLMNLIGNARQALEQQERGGTIRLKTSRTDRHRVLLEVIDDGPGIPSSILARIFDPFFTTKPAGVGTGLGLAIVLSVVREHGGSVNVDSPPAGGAKFTIELPAAAVAASLHSESVPFTRPVFEILQSSHAELASLPAVPHPAAYNAALLGSRILVVEDEPTVARLISDVLQDEGFSVEVMLDGRAALDRIQQENFDLVVCDMKMPGVDGQHFYRALLRSGNLLCDRFLFVTGDIVSARTHEFLEKYQLPHVAKPFRVEELTEKVWRVLAVEPGKKNSIPTSTKMTAAKNG